MTDPRDASTEHQIQIQTLDVAIVDVLAHLEALLRASHSIQRALLELRSEAPPPSPAPPEATLEVLRTNTDQMRQDCQTLIGIIEDLASGIDALAVRKP